MNINTTGWCDEAEIHESPHFNERPEGAKIDLIVIHNISLPPGKFGTSDIESLFMGCLDCKKDPAFKDLEGLRVSSHFFITRTGKLHQFVSCNDRAWHAGVSYFNGKENCNDFSIGIEMEGTDDEAFELEQYRTLAELIDTLSEHYPIAAITGHSNIAPDRKTDPGPHFNWLQLIHLCGNGKNICFPFIK